jgi:signal transduction histidine kinase
MKTLVKNRILGWFFSSLANQLLFTYLLIITIALLAVSFWALLTIKSESTTELQRQLQVEAGYLALEIDSDLTLDSKASRQRIQEAVDRRATKLGVAITVVDKDGHVLADSGPDEDALGNGQVTPAGENISSDSEINDALAGIIAIYRRNVRATNTNWLYVAVPIRSAGMTAGVIRVGVQLTEVEARLRQNLIVFLVMIFLTGLITVLISLWLAARVNRPVKEISKLAKEISISGDLSSFLPVHRSDEIGELSLSFNQMIGRLREQERLRQEFIANASHELKTPTMAIGSVVDAMLAGAAEDPDLRSKFLRSLEKLVDRQALLIRDLLDISKLDSSTTDITDWQHEVSLDQILAEAVDQVRPQAQNKDIQLIVPDWLESATHNGFRLKGNADQLQRAFINLLGNAVNYTPSGGRVTLTCAEADHARAQIVIQDTGAGIAADDLPHIFERFYRGEKSRAREAGGSGLGLAITNEIIARHYGTIDVESTVGKGSTFKVTLPASRSQAVTQAERHLQHS